MRRVRKSGVSGDWVDQTLETTAFCISGKLVTEDRRLSLLEKKIEGLITVDPGEEGENLACLQLSATIYIYIYLET